MIVGMQKRVDTGNPYSPAQGLNIWREAIRLQQQEQAGTGTKNSGADRVHLATRPATEQKSSG